MQKVRCPGCGGDVPLTPAAFEEGKVRCPGCQKVLKVAARRPATQAAAPAPALETQRASPARAVTPPTPLRAATAAEPAASVPMPVPTKPKSRLPLIVGGSLLGGAAAAALVVWAVLGNATPATQTSVTETPQRPAATTREPVKVANAPRLLRIADQSVRPGQNQKFEVRVERQGFEGPIKVQLEELPGGVLTAPVTIPPDRDGATFELFARPDAPEGGAKEARVVADAGGQLLTGSVWISVRSQQAFQLFVDPVVLRAGSKMPVSVRVDRQGIRGPIELDIRGFPSQVSAQPTSIPADKNETSLLLTIAANAREGKTRGRIQGTTPDARADAPFELEIRMQEAIRIGSLPSVTIRSGKTREVAVEVERLGYTGPIKLRVEGDLPQGLKVAPAEEIKATEKRGVLQLEAGNNLRDGTAELKVLAVGDGNLTAEAPLALTTRQVEVRGELFRLMESKPGVTNPIWDVAFSADGRYAAAAALVTQVRVWELGLTAAETKEQDQPFKGSPLRFKAVAFYPTNNRWLLAAASDGSIRRWEFPKNPTAGGRIMGLHEPVQGMPVQIETIVFDVSGSAFLSAGGDQTFRVWKADVTKPKIIGTPARFQTIASPRAVAFLPNGKDVLIAGGQGVGLIDLTLGRPIREFLGHKPVPNAVPVNAVAVSPDGKHGLTAGSDTTAKLWDLASGDLVQTFNGHSDWVTCVAFTNDGRWAASASLDRTIRIWEVATGEEVRRFSGHTLGVMTLAFSPDGNQLLSGSLDGTVRVWAFVK